MSSELLFQRNYRVASHTVGPHGTIRPSSLLGLLEDAAGDHAAAFGLSVVDLLPRGLTWVLTRYHLRLLRVPAFGEEIRVVTWPSGRRGRFALRDFEVLDAAGEIIAVATTSWAILDLSSRRALRVDDVVPPEYLLDRRALADDFPVLDGVDAPAAEVELPVMLRDLDMNLHVNHAVYLQWALEAVPIELLKHGTLRDVEIAYLGEAKLGDRVVSTIAGIPADDESVFAHAIVHRESGRELARLRTAWRC